MVIKNIRLEHPPSHHALSVLTHYFSVWYVHGYELVSTDPTVRDFLDYLRLSETKGQHRWSQFKMIREQRI